MQKAEMKNLQSILGQFEKLISVIQGFSMEGLSSDTEEMPKEQMRFFADCSTRLWRLRQKMLQPGTDKPYAEMQKAYRHFESVWDTLAQFGIEIQDHTDMPYSGGLSLEVIDFQVVDGINEEKVIETIKPTIYYKSKSIQMGVVIVGKPESPKSKGGVGI
ncbi:hypothetical protein [Candidatus Magnetominusculus xianensis]|uniref:hypothetical protein n=1 Tax=Candidatus Magnetominusculus xianensis TaxID=1748249 RepID=UPI0012EE43C3|nr:hypothetical protein [Candidatus Magnetominusculus xianensis]MBF0402801.1 hypothetical protein [Nitrospirota bacterium]